MADDRMKNIAGLFKEGRTRVIIITTLTILLVAVIVGLITMHHRGAAELAGTGVTQAPSNIQSVPFQAPNPYYARLQQQQNAQQAKQAAAAGSSAIPTIINAGTVPANAPPTQGALGFQSLARLQEEGGSFHAKTLNLNQGGPPTSCTDIAGAILGAPVYDKNGNVVGFLGLDGKFRDRNGNILGAMGPNGLNCGVTTPSLVSPTLGGTTTALGTPIYDKNGRLVGFAGPDGKVRDVNGNVLGTVGPDGIARDTNGNIIGQASSPVAGTPVYDSNGNLLGYVGPDGKVRDKNGNIIGTVGPDGLVRDANGNVIGKVGTPVYDANGKLLGFAGPDGKVRDVNGNVIGTVGPDGVVRDANGNIIGKAGAIAPGTPIYDSNGRIIGYVGPDGKVRDANGNVVGTLGVDGKVRDANGNIIGGISAPPASTAKPIGTAIYDANGRLIGYVGADGKLRDANGNIIGTLGPDGLVRDANGNIVGATSPTLLAASAQANRIAQQAAIQAAITNNQLLQQQMNARQQAMATQANQLLVAWQSPQQQFVPGNAPQQAQSGGTTGGGISGGGAASGTAGQTTSTGPVFIKAGSVMFATLTTAVNSDQPGPVLATIVGGDYSGGTLLGSITNQGQAVLITFNTLTLPNFSKSIGINAVAIDQNTARTALSTDTNNHYLLRYGSLFAASLAQGYGQAFTQSGSTTSTNGLTTQTSTPSLSPGGKFLVALGNVGTQFSNQLNNVYNTPPTVQVASGTAIGILYLTDVQLPSS